MKEATAENKWIPEWDPNRKPFAGWAARTWNWYYLRPINDEVPPEKCGMPLTKEEREAYLKDLNELKKARKDNPGVPFNYDMVELEYE